MEFNRIHVMGRVFSWIQRQGGVKKMAENADKKSGILYDVIEKSNGFYVCPVEKSFRSRMNVPYRIGSATGDDALEKDFLAGAKSLKMLQLAGHRSVGGIRASLYNAVTIEDVEALAKYMTEFYQNHKK